MLLALFSLLAPLAFSADRYVVVPFDEIAWEGDRPAPDDTRSHAFPWGRQHPFGGYVVLDGGGEAFLEYAANEAWSFQARHPVRCAMRVSGGTTGRVFLAKPDLSGFEVLRFKIPDGREDPAAKSAFHAAEEAHYSRLLGHELPGSAWFRYRAATARAARGLGPSDAGEANAGNPWRIREAGFDETFELFTGNRALAENLDLDRILRGLADEESTVAVDSIEGVTTRAMDWKALVANLHPDLDPLANLVPADQHGVFFPSFEAMTRVFDEVDEAGTPVLQFASSRAEDQRSKDRYQEQLCLPLSAAARLLGPAVVASVAITGSDPYLPSGTDLAILFDCKAPQVLQQHLVMRHAEAQSKGAQAVEGSAGKIAYRGVRSPDRRISSYSARIGDTVVVTNSPVQLERIAAAAEGRAQPLAKADEYVWFRDRYKRGDPAESALLVLTDATIRRWAGPRSRIGDSRRVRAMAAMTEIHARNLDAVALGKTAAGTPAAQPDLPYSSDFSWGADGVQSAVYGRVGFLTPVAELPLDRVTPSEKAAYERFRAGFQSRWSTVFDPIALRLSFTPTRMAGDLTVMPLVVDSEYREFRNLTLDATLDASAGDAHEGTLFHFAFALGKRSEVGRFLSDGLGPFAQQLGADPLGWIGGGIALYADRDAFWEELLGAPDRSRHLEKGFYRMPLALHVEVQDPLKLAAFLVAVRAMADGTVPGMTRWETRTWHEQSYVAINAQEEAGLGDELENMAIYYAAMPDAFVLSLREDVVQRAIDRRIARKAGEADAARDRPWLGSSLGLRAERDAVDLFSGLAGQENGIQLQRVAWSALPILTEWKRRFPSEDPVAVHERVFGVRLTTPAGGSFAWDEAMQSMAASDYGSPAAQKEGPRFPAALARVLRGEFGLSFEGEGLRARAELERDGK
ncbi:MAG: hypothetical protein ACKVXR_10660 [Planctomycetota bacterium]